jgi:glycosyltransferase involved in cell wall biosynthesis
MDISYFYLMEERGPGGARNFGFQHASGGYICFLDSDDWLDINYLGTAENLMSKHQAEIGMCGLVRNYDAVAYSPVYKCSYQTVYTIDGITAFRMLSGQYDFGVTISPSPVNKIYRKSFLENNKIRFLENVYYEDVLFSFQTLLTDCRVITVPNVYYHHYRRPGSIVQSLTKRHFDDFEIVFTKVKDYLIEHFQYDEYAFNYYKIMERFYNLIIRQVFQFSRSEQEKKKWMQYSFHILKKLIVIEEYMEYFDAEDIRRHLQPFLEDTTLF